MISLGHRGPLRLPVLMNAISFWRLEYLPLCVLQSKSLDFQGDGFGSYNKG